jgi:hypothetical protein
MRSCGSGLIVRPRVFPPGAKAEIIPPDTWREMEAIWAREFGAERGTVDPSKRDTHYHVWEYASGGSPRRTIAIFDERSSAERYADEHVDAFENPYVARGDAQSGYAITSTVSNYAADLGAIRVEVCHLSNCTPDV